MEKVRPFTALNDLLPPLDGKISHQWLNHRNMSLCYEDQNYF